VVPSALKMLTLPDPPTPTVTRLPCDRLGSVFSTEALGMAEPAGQIRRWVSAVAPTAVTLRTTAVTPVAGTPARPTTPRSVRRPWPNAWNVARVSTIRVGGTATYPASATRGTAATAGGSAGGRTCTLVRKGAAGVPAASLAESVRSKVPGPTYNGSPAGRGE
jgi:hypothetical protein